MRITFDYYSPENMEHISGVDDDASRLRDFIEDTKFFLWRLTIHRPAFIDDLFDDLTNAWNAAHTAFDKALTALKNVLEYKLEEHRLTGPQLRLKLRNVEQSFGDLISGLGSSALGKLLNAINIPCLSG